MFLLDYTTDYYGRQEETRVLYSDSEVIDFVADKSDDTQFQVTRINKYEKGALYSYELTIVKGRIVLNELPSKGGNE